MLPDTVDAPEWISGPATDTIDIARLTIDERVQRSLDEPRAMRIANDLDLSAIGTFVVSARLDGTLIVLDGQHRLAALRAAGHNHHHARCDIRHHLTLQEEAALFRRLNTSRQPTIFVDHEKAVLAGDPTAVDIDRILTKYGWKIRAGRNHNGVVRAVKVVRNIHQGLNVDRERGPEALEATIVTITKAFGHGSDGVRAEILTGVGQFVLTYTGWDAKTLAARLEAQGLPALRRDADRRKVYPLRLDEAVTLAVAAAYNGRRRSKGIAVLIGSV